MTRFCACPITRARRLSALLIGLLFALALLVSAGYVLFERHHDCCGEHCPVCAAIAQRVAFLKVEGGSVLCPAAAQRADMAAPRREPAFRCVVYASASPVSLKVKLSD